MWIDNSEIKDRGSNYAQWDIAGQEIERIKKLSNSVFLKPYLKIIFLQKMDGV